MSRSKALLTIGLPVYNGELFLREALDSIITQSFREFIVIVSDNFSIDSTAKIVDDYMQRDSRIRYMRQEKNLGAVENFLTVASNICTPYFMWFACDDVMAPGFLQSCIGALETNPKYSMAFTGLCNIDSLGRNIREYPHMASFSGVTNWRSIARFLLSPEVFGKANLIYSVYRTPVLRRTLSRVGLPTSWGGDMGFVLAALIQGGVAIFPEVLFRKRWVREGDSGEVPLPVHIDQNVLHQSCPLEHYQEYEKTTIEAAVGSRFAFLTAFLMKFRHKRLIRMKHAVQENLPEKSCWTERKEWVADAFQCGLEALRTVRGLSR